MVPLCIQMYAISLIKFATLLLFETNFGMKYHLVEKFEANFELFVSECFNAVRMFAEH